MKTKNLSQIMMILLAVVSLTFSGCQKEKEQDNTNGSSTLQQLSEDDNYVEIVSDEATNDINSVLSGGNFKSTNFWPCNATIDSTNVANDTITFYITYNGLNCPETLYRTGKIEIKKKVGTHWKDEGATVIFTYINFHITRVSNGKSITINGTKTFQNVTGGFIHQLGNHYSSIVFKTWGTISVTFSDNTTRIWNVARQRTYTGSPWHLVLTVDGFGTQGNYNNLVVWGVNRNGENFYTSISQSVVFRQVCGWDPCSGIKVHEIPSADKSATITFGFNSHNEPVQGDECPTKYRLDWQHGIHSGTIYLWL